MTITSNHSPLNSISVILKEVPMQPLFHRWTTCLLILAVTGLAAQPADAQMALYTNALTVDSRTPA